MTVPDIDDRSTPAQPSPTLLPLLILESVLERDGSWGITELANALDVPKARIHRHVANLRQAGFLAQEPTTRRYEPGWRLVVLGQQIEARAQLVTVARPVMKRLRDSIGRTVVLSQLTDAGVTVTDVVPGGSPIDVVLAPGIRFEYNSSAQGKVGLAFGSPRQLEVWSRLIHERRTPSTIVDADLLAEQVRAAREQGWAAAPDETFSGVNALAAPVFNHAGEVTCTLAVVSSIHYLPDPPPEEVVTALKEAAETLSRELGHRRS